MAQAKKAVGDSGRAVTRRVVLRKVRVVVIGPELEGKTNEEIATRLKVLVKDPAEAWMECGEFTGSKTQAIEAFAGKPGTPTAVVGEFKAPPARGFQGGAIYRQPALPLVEREVIR